MVNPILSAMTKNSPISQANAIINALKGNDPNAMYQILMQSNPQFADFVRQNEGRTPEQIASAYGVDPSILNLIR